MFDLPQDPFGRSGGFGPAPRPRPATTHLANPFSRLFPEDRDALTRPETLRSPFVRRWLGFTDGSPAPDAIAPTGPPGAGATDNPDRYEVFAGWQVPDEWDLKDLGRAALDNAAKAGSRGENPSAGQTISAAASVDTRRAEDDRSTAAQVRAANAIRNRTERRAEVGNRPAAGTSDGAGSVAPSTSGRKPAPGPWTADRNRAASDAGDRIAGAAGGLPSALWRELGARLLDARNKIKQESIEREGRHGDNATAHDAGVIATARSVDAGLPGNTARATVNSALTAGAKYRESRAEKAPETERAARVAAFSDRYRTFRREAAHASEKALRARFAGNDLAARGYEQDAENYRRAAADTLADARNAGVDAQQFTVEDAGPGVGGDAGVARKSDPGGIIAAGAEEDPASNAAKRPPGGGHPLMRKQLAHAARHAKAQERAEADLHAGLGDIEHEADRRERQRAADAAFRAEAGKHADLTGTMLRGLDIAVERGAVPQQVRPWLERVVGFGTRTVADPRHSHRYLAVLDRLALLRERRPAVFDTLPPRLRTAVAVHRYIGDTQGGVDSGDRSAANLEALKRRSDLIDSTVLDLHKPGGLKTLGFVADWLPVIGELKSGVETLIALRHYAAARERGDSAAAEKYREEAAWGLVGLVPLLGYSRKGRKLLRQLAAPVGKLSVKAGDAFARKIEEAVARHGPKRGNGDKPEKLPKNFERDPRREFSERWAARRKLAILKRYGKYPKKENLKLKDVFGRGFAGLDANQQKIASIAIAGAKGKAGERKIDGMLQDGGFSTAVKKSGRAVTIEKLGQRRYDIATTDKFRSFLGLFVFPGTHKGTIKNGKTVQIEVKSGDAEKTPHQRNIDKKVNEAAQQGNPKKVANRKDDDLFIVGVEDLQLPTHWIDKEVFAAELSESLTKQFGKKRTEAFLKDLDEFYRNSTDENPIPFGVVLLYLAGRLHRLDGEEQNRL